MEPFRVEYGAPHFFVQVTDKCKEVGWLSESLLVPGVFDRLFIPAGDTAREAVFHDHLVDVRKWLRISLTDLFVEANKCNQLYYETDQAVMIGSLMEFKILAERQEAARQNLRAWFVRKPEQSAEQVLSLIHQNLHLDYGSFRDEYAEQTLAVKYIKPEAKVLELGGNIGRNSLVIATLLRNQSNLVTVECDSFMVARLGTNMLRNRYRFNIEAAAISNRRIIQQGTISRVLEPDERIPPGFHEVPTITWAKLSAKYGLDFDTLVVDVEGALYQILLDSPEILNGIKLLIIENDFLSLKDKVAVDEIFRQAGLSRIYSQAADVGMICAANFYEVWQRTE